MLLICKKESQTQNLWNRESKSSIYRFNPNLGGLFRGSFEGGMRGGITPCLKLYRITLETSNLARKYRPVFSKYAFWYQGPLHFPNVSFL